MFFPVSTPVLQGLNSYYIRVEKLIEHFHGEIGTGVIYFRGALNEGAVFFESGYFQESFFKSHSIFFTGGNAFKEIMEHCRKNNCEIYVYSLESDQVYLWSEILKAVKISSEKKVLSRSDLEKEIEDYKKNRSTGYILIQGRRNRFGLFFAYGELAGFLLKGQVYLPGELNQADFFKQIFALLSEEASISFFKEKVGRGKESSISSIPAKEKKNSDTIPMDEVCNAMGQAIKILEDCINNNKKIKLGFHPLLKKKFMEHLDEYEFLDPFAADLIYKKGVIKFYGDGDSKKIVESILICLSELAQETVNMKKMPSLYKNWLKKYGYITDKFNIIFPFK